MRIVSLGEWCLIVETQVSTEVRTAAPAVTLGTPSTSLDGRTLEDDQSTALYILNVKGTKAR